MLGTELGTFCKQGTCSSIQRWYLPFIISRLQSKISFSFMGLVSRSFGPWHLHPSLGTKSGAFFLFPVPGNICIFITQMHRTFIPIITLSEGLLKAKQKPGKHAPRRFLSQTMLLVHHKWNTTLRVSLCLINQKYALY